MKIAHVTSGVVRLLFVIVTAQPPLPVARPTTPRLFPVVTQKWTAPAVGGVVHAVVALYLTESAKYASSAVTRFRRSDFIEAMYAFAFVLANFGIAMAAKMPMITTTISSSMSVKPLRFIFDYPPRLVNGGRKSRIAASQAVFLGQRSHLRGLVIRLRRSNSRGWRIESPRVH